MLAGSDGTEEQNARYKIRHEILYRRLRAKLGPSQATVAAAHAIARVVYRMLKYRIEYDPLSVNECQKQYEEQQIKYMKKRAAKLGYELLPVTV